jgi:steroid delta-isomerase
MAATPDQVREVIHKYFEAWSTHDKDLLLEIFAEDATWVDPVGSPEFRGHDGVAKFWDFAHQGDGRQLTPKLTQVIACANEGILRFTMEIRLPEIKQGLDLHVVDHFVINDDGKIQTARAFWDEGCGEKPEGWDFYIPNMDEAHQ